MVVITNSDPRKRPVTTDHDDERTRGFGVHVSMALHTYLLEVGWVVCLSVYLSAICASDGIWVKDSVSNSASWTRYVEVSTRTLHTSVWRRLSALRLGVSDN